MWHHVPVDSNRSYTFICISPIQQYEGGIASIQWLINGVLLEDLNLTNVNSAFDGGVGGLGILTFSRARLDQNSTSVTCTVHLMSGQRVNVGHSLIIMYNLKKFNVVVLFSCMSLIKQ